MKHPTDHTQDHHCAGHVDPETDCCTVCGALHGDPCWECGGCAFHRPGCSLSDDEQPEPPRKRQPERLVALLARYFPFDSRAQISAALARYRSGDTSAQLAGSRVAEVLAVEVPHLRQVQALHRQGQHRQARRLLCPEPW